MSQHSQRKRVLLLHTGGTLGMALPEDRRLDLGPAEHLDRLLSRVPELREIADIELIAPWNLDSSDVGPQQWQALANLIVDRGGVGKPGGFTGIVIIHGTDTLAYAASALAMMLRGLDRPVVFTGSQRPLEAWRTDARANLAAAVECATLPIPEVLVVFGDSVLRACRATKADANDYQAFDTPSQPPLGRIGVELEIDWSRVRRCSQPFELKMLIDSRILALTMFPGLDPAALRSVVGGANAERLRAVIVRGFGVGNVPMLGEASLLPLIESLASAGVAVIVGSQCVRGHTDLCLYAAGRAILAAGAIEARDMTFEACVTKAMWALAQPENSVAQWFARDLAGEITLSGRVTSDVKSATLDG